MLSRLDTQPLLDLQTLNLSTLLHDIAEQQRLVGTQTFSTQIAPNLWIAGDADRLRQIMLNLLDNARKYTPSGGHLMLRAQPVGQQVHVTVQDSGAGIPADALPHLFERFYRVDSARARKQGGSGLGLAIVHSLVQAHGGYITVQSQLGEGTSIELLFPQAQSSANLQLLSGEASAMPAIIDT